MGGSRTDADAWKSYSSATATKSHTDYTARAAAPHMTPTKFETRESTKSDANPNPTPVIVGLDVTGSMGRVVEACRKGLGTLFIEIIERAPVSDPHVMALAIGDFDCDKYPIQATQFEADPVTIGKQVEELYLEGGGGANGFEGYLGPLYLASLRTNCDAIKQGRKGFLFTIGDEPPQMVLRKESVKQFFNDDVERDYTAEELIALAQKDWHYYHLMIEEGNHMSMDRNGVVRPWTKLLGQNAIPVSDHTKVSEIIISILELIAGKDKDAVIKSWSGATSMVVAGAIKDITTTADVAGDAPVAV